MESGPISVTRFRDVLHERTTQNFVGSHLNKPTLCAAAGYCCLLHPERTRSITNVNVHER